MFKLSIVTATHDTRLLKRVAWSIAQQVELPGEWVICVNGLATAADVVRETRDLKGVEIRIIRAPETKKTIGSLKRFGFMEATGDALVECDHDDLLAPDCIAELHKAFDDGAEFVYSNMAAFVGDDWQADIFWPSHTPVRPCNLYGHDLLEGVADFTPHNILLASHSGPCHVRAWTKEIYARIGGHDEAVNFSEDLELLCKTYLARPRVAHIDRPLYAFYIDPNRERDEAKLMTEEIPYWTAKHALPLVHEWCDRNGYAEVVMASAVREFEAIEAGHVSISGERADLIPDAWRMLRHGGFLSMRVKSMDATLRHWFPVDRSETARFQLSYMLPRADGLTDLLLVADRGQGPLSGINHWTPCINEAEVLHWLPVLKTYGASWEVREGRCLLYGEEARKAAAFLERVRPGCFVAVEGVAA